MSCLPLHPSAILTGNGSWNDARRCPPKPSVASDRRKDARNAGQFRTSRLGPRGECAGVLVPAVPPLILGRARPSTAFLLGVGRLGQDSGDESRITAESLDAMSPRSPNHGDPSRPHQGRSRSPLHDRAQAMASDQQALVVRRRRRAVSGRRGPTWHVWSRWPGLARGLPWCSRSHRQHSLRRNQRSAPSLTTGNVEPTA